jgi:hypothetical protein
MRMEVSTVLPKAAKSKVALSLKASLTYSVRLIEPRQQQP